MSQSGGEKTEKATPKRMKELRKKGSIGRSADVSTWVTLGAVAVMLPSVLQRGREVTTEQMQHLAVVGSVETTPAVAVELLMEALRAGVWAMAPMLTVAALTAVVVGVAQGGWRFTPMRLHWDQFKPMSGVKKLFGGPAWWNGLKTLLKSAVVGLALWLSIKGLMPLLVASGDLPLSHVLQIAGDGVTDLLRSGVVAGVLLAALDVVVVIRRNRKQTRMSKQEIKEEHKHTEGDPQVKAAIRSRQMAMSRNRMMAAVADADVVVVNPVHVAVALRYEPGTGAPRVVAKGSGQLAAKIRQRATDERVPLVEDVPLARALHAVCEVGQEVPEHLFVAVARVLAFVMTLRRKGVAAGQHVVPGGSTTALKSAAEHKADIRAAKKRRRATTSTSTTGTTSTSSTVQEATR